MRVYLSNRIVMYTPETMSVSACSGSSRPSFIHHGQSLSWSFVLSLNPLEGQLFHGNRARDEFSKWILDIIDCICSLIAFSSMVFVMGEFKGQTALITVLVNRVKSHDIYYYHFSGGWILMQGTRNKVDVHNLKTLMEYLRIAWQMSPRNFSFNHMDFIKRVKSHLQCWA